MTPSECKAAARDVQGMSLVQKVDYLAHSDLIDFNTEDAQAFIDGMASKPDEVPSLAVTRAKLRAKLNLVGNLKV